jgi:hypothetical protein
MAKQTFTTGQVLTAAQMTSLQQTAMLGGSASAKTASYTLVAADAGTAISMSNASATTITVNTALFAAGDTVQITNLGAGVCTITAGTATVNTSATLALAQYESGTLDFTSTSAAVFIKAATGGMNVLSTTTLSGASTSISITPTGYNSLYIFVTGVGCSTNTDFFAQINSVTATTYVNSSLGTIDATTGSVNGLKNGCYFNFAGANGYGTSTDNALVLQIPDPNGTKRKSMIFNAAYQLTGAAGVQFGMANANTAAAISIIKFELSGGATFSGGGTVTVYGVK